MHRVEAEERRRVRLLYSLGDLQIALSAIQFLMEECEFEEKYNKIELRRFRCFETTMIVSYARPFSESKGGVPPLSLKMAGVTLNADQAALHRKLLKLRNKVFAHSDAEMMRMAAKPTSFEFDDGWTFNSFRVGFDEGLHLSGLMEMLRVNELLHIVFQGIWHQVHRQAQADPDSVMIRREPKSKGPEPTS